MSNPVEPTAWDVDFGRTTFRRYRKLPGSEHIASAMALTYLSASLRAFRPKVVMELGSGIGTMTDALLMHPQRPEFVWTVESNLFCRQQLARNMAHHDATRFAVLTSAEEIRAVGLGGRVDLLLGDGGLGKSEAPVPEELAGLKLGSVVFAEGVRREFRALVQKALPPGLHVAFAEYGVTYRWGLGPLPLLWRFTKGRCQWWPRRVRRKGCWIGRVEAAIPNVAPTPAFP